MEAAPGTSRARSAAATAGECGPIGFVVEPEERFVHAVSVALNVAAPPKARNRRRVNSPFWVAGRDAPPLLLGFGKSLPFVDSLVSLHEMTHLLEFIVDFAAVVIVARLEVKDTAASARTLVRVG